MGKSRSVWAVGLWPVSVFWDLLHIANQKFDGGSWFYFPAHHCVGAWAYWPSPRQGTQRLFAGKASSQFNKVVSPQHAHFWNVVAGAIRLAGVRDT